ncbi:MAG: hypothetical protein WC441_02280 [Patescibacteria group bacterium]
MKKIAFLLIIALAAATILPSCSTTTRGFDYAGLQKKQKKAKGRTCKYMKHHNQDRLTMKGVF